MLMPADGIYAGLVTRPASGASWLPAAIYIGQRPTFYDERAMILLEVHVLDFDGDLYGEDVRVQFIDRLRDDQRFDAVDALAAQLRPRLRIGARGAGPAKLQWARQSPDSEQHGHVGRVHRRPGGSR